MIEIRLLEGSARLDACARLDIPPLDTVCVYEAASGGSALGVCVFDISGAQGHIYRVEMAGQGLAGIADGLLRSALSLMVQRDAATATAGVADERLLRGAGFRSEGGVWRRGLDESFFAGCGARRG